jgi:hypothetical protein
MKTVLISILSAMILTFVTTDLPGLPDSRANAACSGDINTACSQVNKVLGGQTPISASTSMTGDLAGNLPSPTVARLHLGITAITHGSSPYSASSTDSAIECDASGGAVSISLPGTTTGKMILIKKIDSSTNACTISTALDGTANYQLSEQNQSITAYYNATTTHWNVLSGNANTALDNVAGIAGGVSDSISNMSLNGTFNPAAPLYGGASNYPADSTAAIQNALNAGCGVSSSTAAAAPVILPPGSFRLTYPLWLNCNKIGLWGGGYGPTSLLPTYDFGYTLLAVGSAYPGMTLAAPLISGGPGNSFVLAPVGSAPGPWIDLSEWRGQSGIGNTCTGGNINGCSAFTIEAYVNDTAAADGIIVASGGIPANSVGATLDAAFRINAGDWVGTLTTTGSGQITAVGATAPIGSNQYVAETYDGTTVRLYACSPGATGVTPATASATGSVVQPPSSDLAIGLWSGGWKYNGNAQVGSIKGEVYSVRVSNVARQTGTITCPNSAFASDSNTMVLTNGETVPGVTPTPPFIKGYDGQSISGAWGFGWFTPYNTERPGNTGLLDVSIRDLGISGASPAGPNVSGIKMIANHDDIVSNIFMSGHIETGIELWNLNYENDFFNVNVNGSGRYGIDNSSNLNNFYSTQVQAGYPCAVNGGDYYNMVCKEQSGGTTQSYGLVQAFSGGCSNRFNWIDDAEDGGAPFSSALILNNLNGACVNDHGGGIEAIDSSPAIIVDSGGTYNAFGAMLTSNGGSPTEIIHKQGTGTVTANLYSPALVGWSSAALSTTADVVSMSPCKGKVTLVSGAATFNNVCVTPASDCSGRDTTTPANAVTFGVPGASSVTVAGTGTDVIQLDCR